MGTNSRPHDKFIAIFAQRFYNFEDPYHNFFALNLLFQDTSYSLALKYSGFFFNFSVRHNTILISGSKSVKFARKFRIFLKFFTPEGTLDASSFFPQTYQRCYKAKILNVYNCGQHSRLPLN